jgi:hypothetical protein
VSYALRSNDVIKVDKIDAQMDLHSLRVAADSMLPKPHNIPSLGER